ncbi:MAG: HpcH/HpaI aldolase/citrate lyase family protein [Planctomycetota bacterium]
MTTTTSIRSRLASNLPVRAINLGQLASSKLIDIVAMHTGWHAIWIDQEHAAIDQPSIEHLVRACRANGLDSWVRLAPTDYATAMRPLEAGAGGVMAAQIAGATDARQFVEWTRFPPIGRRGLNTSNYEGNWGTSEPAELMARSNATAWVAVQIETASAVDEADAIAAIDGLDHLFVGPADLSVALGVPGQYLHERCVAALQRVSAAVAAAGKTWGILARGPEHAAVCADLGCKLFAFASDLSLVHAGMRATKSTYEKYFTAD